MIYAHTAEDHAIEQRTQQAAPETLASK